MGNRNIDGRAGKGRRIAAAAAIAAVCAACMLPVSGCADGAAGTELAIDVGGAGTGAGSTPAIAMVTGDYTSYDVPGPCYVLAASKSGRVLWYGLLPFATVPSWHADPMSIDNDPHVLVALPRIGADGALYLPEERQARFAAGEVPHVSYRRVANPTRGQVDAAAADLRKAVTFFGPGGTEWGGILERNLAAAYRAL